MTSTIIQWTIIFFVIAIIYTIGTDCRGRWDPMTTNPHLSEKECEKALERSRGHTDIPYSCEESKAWIIVE